MSVSRSSSKGLVLVLPMLTSFSEYALPVVEGFLQHCVVPLNDAVGNLGELVN